MEAQRDGTGCRMTSENLFRNSLHYIVKLICDSRLDGLALFLWKILSYIVSTI